MSGIVYHGSSEPDLEELDAFWPPEGGLGYGVYVAFDVLPALKGWISW